MGNHFDGSIMDAEALCAVNGQVGSLVMDHEGQVVTGTGELYGATGKRAAQVVFSMLQDSQNVLDATSKETLQLLTVSFPSYDYVVTLDGSQIYVVKRATTSEYSQ